MPSCVVLGPVSFNYLLMHGLVDHESTGLAESFVADGTLEGLLFGMNVSMVSQMVLASKCFATNVAWIRTLVRVGALVDEEIVGFGELSGAVPTNILFPFPATNQRTTPCKLYLKSVKRMDLLSLPLAR